MTSTLSCGGAAHQANVAFGDGAAGRSSGRGPERGDRQPCRSRASVRTRRCRAGPRSGTAATRTVRPAPRPHWCRDRTAGSGGTSARRAPRVMARRAPVASATESTCRQYTSTGAAARCRAPARRRCRCRHPAGEELGLRPVDDPSIVTVEANGRRWRKVEVLLAVDLGARLGPPAVAEEADCSRGCVAGVVPALEATTSTVGRVSDVPTSGRGPWLDATRVGGVPSPGGWVASGQAAGGGLAGRRGASRSVRSRLGGPKRLSSTSPWALATAPALP